MAAALVSVQHAGSQLFSHSCSSGELTTSNTLWAVVATHYSEKDAMHFK